MSMVQKQPTTVLQGTQKGLLDAEEKVQLKARQRKGRIFVWLTLLPVVLALALLATLFTDVFVDTLSWQIVEPQNSGQSFALMEGFAFLTTWEKVVELDLAAQGLSPEAIEAFFADKEELRKFGLRNRVELMWRADSKPLRWVVSNSRDVRAKDYGFFKGLQAMPEIKASLKDNQRLYLNPWLDFAFFTKNASRTPIMAGLSSALLGSFWVITLVILFALPIGVGSAVYLEEYAPNNAFTRFIELNLRNLAGVPSIVYGILGLYVFVRLLKFGPVILSAALTMALVILPVVVIASREAIKAVPSTLRQASYGLGATRWQTVSRVILPNAVSGIVTGIILSVARALGETAPLLLVGAAAFVPRLPTNPMSTYTVIPIQIYSWISENDVEFTHVASAGIVTLLIVLLLLYGIAFMLRRRFARKW